MLKVTRTSDKDKEILIVADMRTAIKGNLYAYHELTIDEAEKLRADLSEVIEQAKKLDTLCSVLKDYSK